MTRFRSRTEARARKPTQLAGTLLLAQLGLGAASLVASTPAWAASFPSFQEVKAGYLSSEGRLLDRHGEPLHETRIDARARRLAWVPVDALSPALRRAVVESEDRRFEEHGGVDWLALGKVVVRGLAGRSNRGASTISMQLASILDSPPGARKGRRGVLEKLSQVRRALELENEWSKAQILEAYLNLVSFRGELQGVGAASQGIFGKAPHGLQLEESLILAALIRSPEAREERIEERGCQLGRRLEAGYDCRALHDRLASASLRGGGIRLEARLAPHVAQQLKALHPGASEIRTTLDRGLQQAVLSALRRQVLSVRDQNVHDAAALVLDNRTGEALAYVGGIGDLSSAPHVDGVRARRQAGSTLKPFLYALAFQERYITASSPIEDSAIDVPVFGGVYRPRNYDDVFHGLVPARAALASSLNVPAVRTLGLVGVDPLVRKLRELGFDQLRESDYYGPSLALGTADITLWELTNAFRALANRGVFSPARLEPGPWPRPRRALDAAATFIVQDILSDREARALTFGLENPLALRFWSAAKTGTSKDMRDNWCVGFSSDYTVGVWVGNFSGEPMRNVSGISGAGPAWAEVMGTLHRSRPSRPQAPPRGVVRLATGLGRSEWYLEGTEPEGAPGPAVSLGEGRARRILYPVDGMIIATDPDIPRDRQRIFFEASSAGAGLKWVLNGEELGSASAHLAWAPSRSGSYQLALRDPKGRTVDEIGFVVRGAEGAEGK